MFYPKVPSGGSLGEAAGTAATGGYPWEQDAVPESPDRKRRSELNISKRGFSSNSSSEPEKLGEQKQAMACDQDVSGET